MNDTNGKEKNSEIWRFRARRFARFLAHSLGRFLIRPIIRFLVRPIVRGFARTAIGVLIVIALIGAFIAGDLLYQARKKAVLPADQAAVASGIATLAAGVIAAAGLFYLAAQVKAQQTQTRQAAEFSLEAAKLSALLTQLEICRREEERTWAVIATLSGDNVETVMHFRFDPEKHDLVANNLCEDLNDEEFRDMDKALSHWTAAKKDHLAVLLEVRKTTAAHASERSAAPAPGDRPENAS